MRLQVFDWVKNQGGEPIIPFSGSFENRLVEMPQDEQEVFCKEVRHLSVTTSPLGDWPAATHCLLFCALLNVISIPCCFLCALLQQLMHTVLTMHGRRAAVSLGICIQLNSKNRPPAGFMVF